MPQTLTKYYERRYLHQAEERVFYDDTCKDNPSIIGNNNGWLKSQSRIDAASTSPAPVPGSGILNKKEEGPEDPYLAAKLWPPL